MIKVERFHLLCSKCRWRCTNSLSKIPKFQLELIPLRREYNHKLWFIWNYYFAILIRKSRQILFSCLNMWNILYLYLCYFWRWYYDGVHSLLQFIFFNSSEITQLLYDKLQTLMNYFPFNYNSIQSNNSDTFTGLTLLASSTHSLQIIQKHFQNESWSLCSSFHSLLLDRQTKQKKLFPPPELPLYFHI